MNYIHEAVRTESSLPAKIFINSVMSVQRHWHNSLEILLFLKGEVLLQQDGEERMLHPDDVILINSNRIHSLQGISEDNLMLTIQLPKQFLLSVGIDLEHMEFHCSWGQGQSAQMFVQLRSLLAEIAITHLQEERFYDAKLGELLHGLIYFLGIHCSAEKEEDNKTVEELDRLSLAIKEIQRNYNTSLTLGEVAEVQGLSRNYFSHFFKKHMGVTFLEYLNGVRLEHAYKELMSSQRSLTEIALDHGFPNSKSLDLSRN